LKISEKRKNEKEKRKILQKKKLMHQGLLIEGDLDYAHYLVHGPCFKI